MKVSEQKALGARIQRKKPRESNIFKSMGKATNSKNINGMFIFTASSFYSSSQEMMGQLSVWQGSEDKELSSAAREEQSCYHPPKETHSTSQRHAACAKGDSRPGEPYAFRPDLN